MKAFLKRTVFAQMIVSSLVIGSVYAQEEEASPPRVEKKATSKPARLDVQDLKKRYWNEKEEYDVVQNRTYSKSGKIELQLFGGFILGDPFLTIYNTGGSLGYHFSEYLGVSLLAWKSFSSDSGAAKDFQDTIKTSASTNPLKGYYGSEVNWNFIYGKRNLFGSNILYYDVHALFGLGMTASTTGNYLTPSLGFGQQTYITKRIAFRTDYRLQYIKETIPGRSGSSSIERSNFMHSITLGFSFFFF